MQTIILQILVFQLCFLVVYELLLRKETFFNWNRAYLLITSVVSLIVPFIKLKSFATVIPSEFMISLPAIVLGELKPIQHNLIESSDITMLASESSFSIAFFWYVGVAFFGGLLLFKLFKIWRYKQTSNSVQKKGYSLTILKNSEDAFSFLRSIFLGDQIENTQKESILKHEMVHVKEKHTLDLLWFEILRIVFWFNPLVYLYQKRITEVHEFIADKIASKYQKNYYENLLAKTFNIAQFSVVNQFYSSSLIKKRIIMLTKEKSKSIKLVKYFTVLPVVLSMLLYVSCSTTELQNTDESKALTEELVIKKVVGIIDNSKPKLGSENKEISIKEYRIVLEEINEFYLKNKSGIDKIQMNKYRDISGESSFLSLISKLNPSSEDIDMTVMVLAEVCVSNLLNHDINKLDESEKKINMEMLLMDGVIKKLKENKYQLPNLEEWEAKHEAKMKLLYEDYSNNVSVETEEVNNDYSGQAEVPFTVLDQAPIYPGCDENVTSEELKKCFSMSIAKHVNEHFDTNIAKNNNLSGKQRISTMFKIDKNGMIMDIKVRAPHQDLVTETERVLNLLPKMKHGIHEGRAVTVPYSLPIIIKVN